MAKQTAVNKTRREAGSFLEGGAFNPSRLLFAFIKLRIECVEVFAVEFFLNDTEGFTETGGVK